MAFTIAENWDGVTAPAVPVDWNVDSQIVTSTARSNSAPNSLTLGSGTSGVKYYATYSFADPAHGATMDLTQFFYIDSGANAGTFNFGPTFRCSAATMNNSSTSCYWFYVNFIANAGSQQFRFAKIVNGTVTDLYTVFAGSAVFVPGGWYSVRVVCTGSNTFNVIITRQSDGYTMDQFGVFNASPSVAVQNFVATDITSGDYYGACFQAAITSSKIFMDDAGVNASGGSVILTPRKPIVISTPFRYYRPD